VFHFIDVNYSPFTITGTLKKGTGPLIRHTTSKKANQLCHPSIGLPKNCYDESIAPEALNILAPQEPVHIPQVSVSAFGVGVLVLIYSTGIHHD